MQSVKTTRRWFEWSDHDPHLGCWHVVTSFGFGDLITKPLQVTMCKHGHGGSIERLKMTNRKGMFVINVPVHTYIQKMSAVNIVTLTCKLFSETLL